MGRAPEDPEQRIFISGTFQALCLFRTWQMPNKLFLERKGLLLFSGIARPPGTVAVTLGPEGPVQKVFHSWG